MRASVHGAQSRQSGWQRQRRQAFHSIPNARKKTITAMVADKSTVFRNVRTVKAIYSTANNHASVGSYVGDFSDPPPFTPNAPARDDYRSLGADQRAEEMKKTRDLHAFLV
jgi:hypothetical protein